MIARKITIVCLISIFTICISTAVAQYDRSESSGDYALPVTLLSFSASGGNDAVILDWATGSEIDLMGFNLYRSTESVENFDRLNSTLIPSQGGAEFTEYEYIDGETEVGVDYFYRLSTIELNGSEHIIGATISGHLSPTGRELTFSLRGSFPDPFNSQASIAFSVHEYGRISLQVYDLSGRKIITLLDRILSPGEYVESFNGDQLPSGVYLCRLHDAQGFSITHKMVLLR